MRPADIPGGMEMMAPGVSTLPLEFEHEGSMRSIWPAAVAIETGVVLVDTGFPDTVSELESQLEMAGFGFDQVELIVITHQDIDHAGGLEAVKRHSGAPVLAHTDDAPYIAGDRDLKGSFGGYTPVPVDIELVDGVTIRTSVGPMRVVATPGHTPGHVSLYLPEEHLLLAADAITAEAAFDGPNEDATLDMDAAVESIGRLAELDVERTLCFHGGVVEHDAERISTIYEALR